MMAGAPFYCKDSETALCIQLPEGTVLKFGLRVKSRDKASSGQCGFSLLCPNKGKAQIFREASVIFHAQPYTLEEASVWYLLMIFSPLRVAPHSADHSSFRGHSAGSLLL